jgi:hypothetical protein
MLRRTFDAPESRDPVRRFDLRTAPVPPRFTIWYPLVTKSRKIFNNASYANWPCGHRGASGSLPERVIKTIGQITVLSQKPLHQNVHPRPCALTPRCRRTLMSPYPSPVRELVEKLAQRYSERLVSLCSTTTSIPSISGARITAFLDEIYRKRAKFCVVFVSTEYEDRKWTIHKLRSAQAKAQNRRVTNTSCR